MDREELEGVIGHEMSHIKNHDIRLLLIVGTLIGLAALLSSILWRTAFWGSIGEGDEGGGRVRPGPRPPAGGQLLVGDGSLRPDVTGVPRPRAARTPAGGQQVR